MFDFKLIVQEAEKAAEFWTFSQNWFDILSLVLTILSLWLAFWLGERGYRRDKKDKAKEEKQLINSEVKLFKNNLEQLLKAIDKQLGALKKYKVDKNFSLEFHQELQVDFLKFVDVKHVYEKYDLKNQKSIDSINELFASLFALNDFRHSLRDSLFIMPAIDLSKQYIPADEDAIQVSDVANEVNSSWIDMEIVTTAHFNEIDGHIATLEKVKDKIEEFLQLKKD